MAGAGPVCVQLRLTDRRETDRAAHWTCGLLDYTFTDSINSQDVVLSETGPFNTEFVV